MFEISFVSILVAGIANVILGMIWYNPKVFGNAWMAAGNIQPSEKGRKLMPVMAFVAFLAAMVSAYVLNHFGIAWGVFDWIGAVELGFWCWLGFAAPALLGSVLWEMKPFKYYAINAGFWLVSFIMMGVILVMMA